MSTPFTQHAREAMLLAEEEARTLRHEYVGTEHVLLGLMRESSGAVVGVLKTFNVSAGQIRQELQRLVTIGPDVVTVGKLPLTPRATEAIKIAVHEAGILLQNDVGPEHLLLGLLLERNGVATKALQNLGLKIGDVAREALKIRLTQFKIVERVVRPIPATFAHKRKIREELLAHLTTIYERELSECKNPTQAMNRAEQRFGDLAELRREFEQTLPAGQRLHYRLERLFGWRAPETATRWMLRLAIQMFLIVAPFCGLMLVSELARMGWDRTAMYMLRPALAILFVFPVALFVLGILYFKMRDAIFGVFGARKSPRAVALWTTLFAIAVFVIGTAASALLNDPATAMNLLSVNLIVAPLLAIGYAVYARVRGPLEIRDTICAVMEIED